MLFNSYIFVLLFLPLSVVGYFLLNRRNTRVATAYLLGMSLWFYAYFNVAYLPLIVGSILLNFSLNKLMRRFPAQRVRKGIMLLGVFINIGVLFYYKYYDFFATNVNSLFGAHWTLLNLVLPLGISFFTFQQVSYMIDSYKGEVPDYPLLDYALFVTFFPQLIAGPIVLHSEIVPQFMDPAKRRFQWGNFSRGLYAFALGMAKKVLLADVFGIAVNYAFANIPSLNSTNALIGVVGYIFQMYFDFSGYGDMAVGLGLMFNIEIPNNFLAPLRARNVKEFWKRWHITLTRFFTRYVYFPLGGSRKGLLRTCINTMVVFFVSGFWHGAGWGYILFGVNWGIAQVIDIFIEKWWKKVPGALQWLCTFAFTVMNVAFFRAATVGDAMAIFQRIGAIDIRIGSRRRFTKASAPWKWNSCCTISSAAWLPCRIGWASCCSLAWRFYLILFSKSASERIRDFTPRAANMATTIGMLTLSILSFSGVSTSCTLTSKEQSYE